MNITYIKSESTVRPALVEYGKTTVYLRRNITEEQRTEEGITTTWFAYDEAALTYDEYRQFQNEQRLNDVEDVLAEIIGGAEI